MNQSFVTKNCPKPLFKVRIHKFNGKKKHKTLFFFPRLGADNLMLVCFNGTESYLAGLSFEVKQKLKFIIYTYIFSLIFTICADIKQMANKLQVYLSWKKLLCSLFS